MPGSWCDVWVLCACGGCTHVHTPGVGPFGGLRGGGLRGGGLTGGLLGGLDGVMGLVGVVGVVGVRVEGTAHLPLVQVRSPSQSSHVRQVSPRQWPGQLQPAQVRQASSCTCETRKPMIRRAHSRKDT